MKKLVTILGARPQFIKASVVSHALRTTGALDEVMIHTGQCFEANMSTVKLHISVAHVQAGLRSFNMAMPEEVNRILSDRISRWLFTPTAAAVAHLRAQGVADARIVPVGGVMYDVALQHGARVDATGGVLGSLGLGAGAYVLATVHRAENTDDPSRLATIVDALEDVSRRVQRPAGLVEASWTGSRRRHPLKQLSPRCAQRSARAAPRTRRTAMATRPSASFSAGARTSASE